MQSTVEVQAQLAATALPDYDSQDAQAWLDWAATHA